MYLVDANILIYTANEDAEQHEAAIEWLDRAINGNPHSVGIPWVNLIAYLRVTTNKRLFDPPADPASSWRTINDWLAQPAVWLPSPGLRFRSCMAEVIDTVEPTGKIVTDTYLAALAREHDLTVVSSDQDFALFADADLVRWIDPTHA